MPERIYEKDVIEFVTVATELCVRLERSAEAQPRAFVAAMLKILPLLYVKATIVSESVPECYEEAERLVTEEDYDFVRDSVHHTMGAYDDYLDVFVEDMKYSDTPIRKTVSEDLADIYQDIRNFVGVYQGGFPDAMAASLAEVMEGFTTYWGQRLVNVVRALHECLYGGDISNGDEFEETQGEGLLQR